ncbi:hypothetical protein FKP32DRAFT_1540303, partial [Trametes sanguinea]
DIAYSTMPYMDLPTLCRFKQTSSTSLRWVEGFLDREFNASLRPYVRAPILFRNTLRMLHGVISGSFALAFVSRNNTPEFEPADLDIYVGRSYAKRLASYLIQVEGYVPDDNDSHPYISRGYTEVIGMSRGAVRVQVIQSETSSALYPLAHFWSSHVMNFLTADGFCVCYPAYTFQGRGLLS